MYRDSAWIFIGGLSYDLSEGDIICVFSQYGEVVNINLIRDRKTGSSKGFAFLCYEDQRSTILAVDNLNGIKLLNRIIRVDHVEEYKIPKEHDDITDELKQLYNQGCAPKPIEDELPRIDDRPSSSRTSSKQKKHSKSKHSKHHKDKSKKSSDSHKKHKKSKKWFVQNNSIRNEDNVNNLWVCKNLWEIKQVQSTDMVETEQYLEDENLRWTAFCASVGATDRNWMTLSTKSVRSLNSWETFPFDSRLRS